MQMFEQIVVLLGGRIAEQLVLEDVSTGASNDIQRASSIARSMVTKYGFSEKLGPIVYGSDQNEVFLGRDLGHDKNYSECVAAEIDAEVREIIESAYDKCKNILKENIDKLTVVSDTLLVREKIGAEEFDDLMNGRPLKSLDVEQEPAVSDDKETTEEVNDVLETSNEPIDESEDK